MAYPIHGKVCRIDKNSTNVSYSHGFTINTNLDLDEITSQGDSWKTRVAGCADWSGVMTLHFAPDNAEQLAIMQALVTATPGTALTDVKFELEDSGDYFSGNIFITGVNIVANVAGKVVLTVNFVGNGALALTIA